MDTYIQFVAEVNTKSIGRFLLEITSLIQNGTKKIIIFLSTPGGSVMHGMAAYNFLRSISIPIEIYNTGRIDSIGGVIFLATDERYAVPNSAFLIHGVAAGIPPSTVPTGLGEKELKEKLGMVEKDRENIAQVYIERLGIKKAEISDMMIVGKTLNTQEAQSMGLIKEVRSPNIPAGAKVITITD